MEWWRGPRMVGFGRIWSDQVGLAWTGTVEEMVDDGMGGLPGEVLPVRPSTLRVSKHVQKFDRSDQAMLWRPTLLPSVSLKTAMNPCWPMEVRGFRTEPPAPGMRFNTVSRSPSTLR